MPEEEALRDGFNDFANAVAAILLHHLHKLSRDEANIHMNRLVDWARSRPRKTPSGADPSDSLMFEVGYSAQVVKACLSFIIAHEYGHIMAGHLNQARTARIRMARGELTVASTLIDQEREADDLANRILQSVLEHRMAYGGSAKFTRFVESILVFAGPVLFFSIDAAIQNVSSQVGTRATQEGESDHPPPGERLEQQNRLFEPFRANPDLFLLADVYGSWLSPTLKVMPAAVKQLTRASP